MAADPDDRRIRKARFRLLVELNEASALLTPDSEELTELWLEDPPVYFAIAFMMRCQRLIRAMSTLVEHGLLDGALVLVRPTVEAAITGLWLLRNDDGVTQLMGYDRKQMRKFVQKLNGEKPESLDFDWVMKFRGEVADHPFVSFEERAGALLPWLQELHFDGHSWVHATIRAGETAFVMDEIEKDPDRRQWAGLLPKHVLSELVGAAVVSLILGRQVHKRAGWYVGDFDELLDGVGADSEMLLGQRNDEAIRERAIL